VKSAYDLADAALPKAGGAVTGDVTLNAQSDLRFADADSSNWVAFQGPATVSSNVTWTLPAADGTTGQVLSTNGSGALSWATASGGGGGGATDKIEVGNTKAEIVDTGSDGRFVVTTEGTERARVDSSGRLLVGTSTSIAGKQSQQRTVQIAKAQASTDQGLAVFHFDNGGQPPNFELGLSKNNTLGSHTAVVSGDNCGNIQWSGSDGTKFVQLAQISGVVDGTPGSDDMPGRLVFSTTADGASSPTERMRVTNGGHFLVAKATPLDSSIAGFETRGAGNTPGLTTITVDNDWCLMVNRLTSDGDLVLFRQANVTEGIISVSGTTVTYGGGHLARWSQLPDEEDPTGLLKGTVMSNLDEMCEWGEEDNEQLNKTKVSDVEGDLNVAGVFVSMSSDETGPLDFFVGMTGDMIIRIAEGVTVQRGDLLMSAGDGTAMPQDDDIIRSKTIAKVTSTHVTCTYDDGSYCVPCVLMAC
jgi:hypothetical protein